MELLQALTKGYEQGVSLLSRMEQLSRESADLVVQREQSSTGVDEDGQKAAEERLGALAISVQSVQGAVDWLHIQRQLIEEAAQTGVTPPSELLDSARKTLDEILAGFAQVQSLIPATMTALEYIDAQ